MLTAAACGRLSRTAVLNKSVATLRLARSFASGGNLPAPAAGTCRLAVVEPCRGPRRERTELAGYKVVSDGSCTSCLKRRADSDETLRNIMASYIGSRRVSEGNCRAAGTQQIRAAIGLRPAERPKRHPNKTRPRAQKRKEQQKIKKRKKTIKTFGDPKNPFLSVP
jgi:hypothetical protein